MFCFGHCSVWKKKTRYIGFTITSCVVTTLLNNLQIIYQYLMTSFSKTNHYHSYISFLLFVCFYLYVSIHKYDIKPCLPDMTIWVKGGGCLIRQKQALLTPSLAPGFIPGCYCGFGVAHILVFCVVLCLCDLLVFVQCFWIVNPGFL